MDEEPASLVTYKIKVWGDKKITKSGMKMRDWVFVWKGQINL